MPLSSIIKTNCKTCGAIAIETSRIEFGFEKLITLKCGHLTTEESLAATDYSSIRSKSGNALMPFQIAGVKFAEDSNARCLIADEQGLGKTVQCQALLQLHMSELTPAIVCTKTTIKKQWMHMFFDWTQTRKVQVISSSKDIPIPGFDIYVITYDLLKNESMFNDVNVKTLILDECQAIKNHLSGRAKAVQAIGKKCEHIIALSGTPIQNNAGEYFTVLNLLQPRRFPEFNDFILDYCDSYETTWGYKVGGLSNIERFKEATKDFIIRRTQSEVLPDLFALKGKRKFHHVELDGKVKRAYNLALQELEDLMYKDEDETSSTAMIAIMTKFRQIVGISKTVECVDFVIDHILSTNRKIVIACHHHLVVDKLEADLNVWLKDGNYKPCVVYRAGDESSSKVAAFSREATPVMIVSTQAAGEGVDGLQHICSDMIMLERQWNPKKEEQVEDRLSRMGQTKPVNFTYIIVSETIDEMFTELVEQKRSYVASALDHEKVDWNQNSLMKELAQILVTTGRKRWSL